MYKPNLFLKIIITVLIAIIVAITNNYSLLWLMLLLISLINYIYKNNFQLFFDLIMVFILISGKYIWGMILIFRIIFLISLLLSFKGSLEIEEKQFIKNLYFPENNKKLKNKLFKKIFDDVVEKNKEEKEKIYTEEVFLDNKIEKDLDRLYLQSKIRFYGRKTVDFKWCYIDTLILIVSIVMFIIFIIVR